MKRSHIVFWAVVFALMAAASRRVASAEESAAKTSPPSAAPSDAQNSVRPVVKGDTLWGITQSVYGDPFLWPSLWEINKSTVSNPHLIYPGQILATPSKEDIRKVKISVAPPVPVAAAPKANEPAVSTVPPSEAADTADTAVAVEPQAETLSEPPAPETAPEATAVAAPADKTSQEPPAAHAPTEPAKTSAGAEAAGHPRREARIIEAGFSPDGIVASVKGNKLLVSQGDIIYVDFPSLKPPSARRMGIYRKMGRVRSPSDGRPLGEEIVRIGTLEIIEIESSGSAAARVLGSREPVQIKDWVLVEK